MTIQEKLKDVLKRYEYHLVLLPRPEIAPLQIMLKRDNGSLEIIGNLDELFVHTKQTPLPTIEKNEPLPQITADGGKSAKVGLTASLGKLFEWLKGALGGSVQYEASKEFHFSFDKLFRDHVKEAAILGWLGNATLNEDIKKVYENRLHKSEFYIINSVIKAKSIKAELKANSQGGADLKGKQEGVVDANLVANASSDAIQTLIADDGILRVFGFQALQLIYDGKNLVNSGIVGGGVVVRADEYAKLKGDTDESSIFDIQ
jgi:hypothetical protein